MLDATLMYRDVFPNTYISELIIDTSDTYVSTGPSSTPAFRKIYNVNTNTIVEEITKEQIGVDLNRTILFVYIIVNGLPADYNCAIYGPSIVMKPVVNLYPYYQKIMGSIKSLENDCSDNSAFINAMLLMKGYEYAMLTCNFRTAIDLYKKFFNRSTVSSGSSKGCGCNG